MFSSQHNDSIFTDAFNNAFFTGIPSNASTTSQVSFTIRIGALAVLIMHYMDQLMNELKNFFYCFSHIHYINGRLIIVVYGSKSCGSKSCIQVIILEKS